MFSSHTKAMQELLLLVETAADKRSKITGPFSFSV